MQRTNSLKKTQMLGRIEGRRKGQQRMKWLNSITYLMDLNLNNFWEFSSGRTSAIWLLFSSFGVSHPAGVRLDFIMIVSFMSSHCGLYFVFGCKISFLIGSSLLLLMVVQHSVVILLVFFFERRWVNVLLLCHFVLFLPCFFINEYSLQTFQYVYWITTTKKNI